MTQTPPTPQTNTVWYVSWRWRIVLPLFAALLLVTMGSAYAVTVGFGRGMSISQDNLLLENVRGLTNRANTLYQRQRQEAQRLAFTVGVSQTVQRGQADVLRDTLEVLARTANLDALILTDAAGVEALGVQRVTLPDTDAYAVNTGTPLSGQPIVTAALAGQDGEAALFQTPDGTLLMISTPLRAEGEIVGAVLAGTRLQTVAADLSGSALASVAIYGADGTLAGTTFTAADSDLVLSRPLFESTLADAATVPIRAVNIAGDPYRTAYAPLRMGGDVLGVVGVFLPDALPFASRLGQQLLALTAATITGVVVTIVFVGVGLLTGRIKRLERTARALATGRSDARTRMAPTDEAGAAGAALDAYANRVQREQDTMQAVIRRQRRETNHLITVLQSIPDGVIVQDAYGTVTFANQQAHHLFDGHTLPPPETLRAITQRVYGALGAAVAPGVYTLGDPQQLSVGERILHVQAAAVQSVNGQRSGTVLLLRDITEIVRKTQQRDRLLQQVEQVVQQPLHELAQTGAFGAPPINAFARAISQRAVALHKLVVQMRELTAPQLDPTDRTTETLRLDTLVWRVANEWRQIALAAGLNLHVSIATPGLHVLADEKRLRWAMGNIIDNAIKYTPPGGTVTLEINGESRGQVALRVRDNGVGIAADELARVTARFYRGNPTMPDGAIIRTPGMGQGLYIAKTIIEAHGGFLRVKSKPGTGTAVYFSVPVTAPDVMDLPLIQQGFEGETVRLPDDYLNQLR